MASVFVKKAMLEKEILSWPSVGILIFFSAFLWAPSRDGLQRAYCLAAFLPVLLWLTASFSRAAVMAFGTISVVGDSAADQNRYYFSHTTRRIREMI